MFDAVEPATLTVEINLAGNNLYHTEIQLGDNKTGITVDTGSTGIVISKSKLPASATKMKKQLPYTPRYTSSGNSYDGAWYSVDVTFSDKDGNTAVASSLPVFGVEKSGVAMMGIGLSRYPVADNQPNPFANISSMTIGGKQLTDIHQGYVFTKDGINLGLTETLMAPFGTTYTVKNFKATVTLTPAAEQKDAKKQTITAPLLVDSGINYMIINPGIKSGSDAPKGYEDADTSRFVAGAGVSLEIGSLSYSFKTGKDASNPGTAPYYVRWGSSSTGHSIINTGRHAFRGFNLLVDAEAERYGLAARKD